MKKLKIHKGELLGFLLLFFSFTFSLAQNVPVRKVLLTLQPGERVATNESCISGSYSKEELYLVTEQGGKIFAYDHGQRKGPFNSYADAKIKNCDDNNDNNCAAYQTPQIQNMEDYLGYSDDGGMVVKFNGKQYGPYRMISNFYVSPDKTWFVAVTINTEMKYAMLANDGVSRPLDGTVKYLQVNASGKKYLVVTVKSIDDEIAAEYSKIDFSKMNNDQMMAIVNKMDEKKKNAGPPEMFIYSNGGKKFGPFPAGSVNSNNPSFPKTGGENWVMIIDGDLYINGTKTAHLDDEYGISNCDLWLSPDGKRYALSNYQKIIFSDGKEYPAPLKIDIENSGSGVVFKWISLENEKDIVAYSKEL